MHIVSWNLNGLEDRHLDERTEAAVFEILLGGDLESVLTSGVTPETPDVILLQEVIERTFTAHLATHLRQAGFTIAASEPTRRSYFEIAAVRGRPILEAQSLPFPRTGQGRRLLKLDLGALTVFTAHLESLRAGAPVRIEQAAFVLDQLRSCERAVFAGDSNLRNAEWEGLDRHGVTDAWEAVGSPREHRATWGNARYDRMWLRGPWTVSRFDTIGQTALPSIGEPPSDHLGLRVHLDG